MNDYGENMNANAKKWVADADMADSMPRCEYCNRIFPSRSSLNTHDMECMRVDQSLNNFRIGAVSKATNAYLRSAISPPILISAEISRKR